MGANLSASVLCPGLVNTNIGNAERNRPEEFGDQVEITDDMRQGIIAMLSGGMDPNDVAGQVFDAIVDQRCYILPHPALDDFVLGRVQHVLDRKEPITIDFEELMRRRAAGQDV